MKLRLTQDPPNTLERREFVKGCFAATICVTGVINAELEMKTMATERHQSTEKAQIRKRLDEWATAFRNKDLNGVLSFFAPETVAFDLVPPLVYTGRDIYRKQWEKLFASYQGSIEYEIRDLSITAEQTLAFSHSINRISGTLQNGRTTGFWLRMTACWQRINGQWFIEHEHVSVPADPAKGTAVLDLKP
jgi:uncharacterized protein (TIGR02246 family)